MESAKIATAALVDLVTDGSQSQSESGTVTSSSSMLKRHEDEVKNDHLIQLYRVSSSSSQSQCDNKRNNCWL
jgi:hypothetical protein